jgi:hypothetical protein
MKQMANAMSFRTSSIALFVHAQNDWPAGWRLEVKFVVATTSPAGKA